MLTVPSLRSAEIQVDGDTCWWGETRPDEGGRTQVVRHRAGGGVDVLPDGFSARSRVHEYGGGAWTVDAGTVVFCNDADQRVYRLDPGGVPTAVSPAPAVPRGWRHGDLRVVPGARGHGVRWVLAVRESHNPDLLARNGEPVDELVAIPLDGAAAADPAAVAVLVTGPDFVSSPCVHGEEIAWVQWNHPNMPFDSTTVMVADLHLDEAVPRLGPARPVAGGPDDPPQSVLQPRWSDDGDLWFVSDRSGWWNLYRWDGERTVHVAPVEAELGLPPWTLGGRTHDALPDGRVVTVMVRDGLGGLALVDPSRPGTEPRRLDTGLTSVQRIAALPSGAVLAVAGGPTLPLTTVLVSPDGEVIQRFRPMTTPDDPAVIEAIEANLPS